MRRCRSATPALLALLTAGCASGTTPAVFETAPAEDEHHRSPPGVVMDPSTELPSRRRSSTSERQLVVLEAPPDVGAARRVIASFFRAVTAESLNDLSQLLDSRARLWNGQQSRRESLQSAWARRLGQLDYGALNGQVIYRDADVETYRASEAVALRESRGLPTGPRSEEILVRVPIIAPTSGGNRLFGDEMVFLLRPAEDGYKIGEIFEDFRLP